MMLEPGSRRAVLNRVRDANGGSVWDTLSQFEGYVAIKGAGVARLLQHYSLQEIVAVGNLAGPSVRFSGFDPKADWCVHPSYVAVRHGDGRFEGVRKTQHGEFPGALDVLEEIYFCGVGLWMCLTTPLTMRSDGAVFEQLESCVERGEPFRRIRVFNQACDSAPVRTSILYVDRAWMVRRVDLAPLCGGRDPVSIYRSAFVDFAGLTLPTLFRVFRRSPEETVVERPACLDIEIFDLKYQ